MIESVHQPVASLVPTACYYKLRSCPNPECSYYWSVVAVMHVSYDHHDVTFKTVARKTTQVVCNADCGAVLHDQPTGTMGSVLMSLRLLSSSCCLHTDLHVSVTMNIDHV